jgi:hypothetical protein
MEVELRFGRMDCASIATIVIPSAAKDLASRLPLKQILRCAQDDKECRKKPECTARCPTRSFAHERSSSLLAVVHAHIRAAGRMTTTKTGYRQHTARNRFSTAKLVKNDAPQAPGTRN